MRIDGSYVLKVAVVDQAQLDMYNESNRTGFKVGSDSTDDFFLNVAERLGTVYPVSYYIETCVEVDVEESLVRLFLLNPTDHTVIRINEESSLEVLQAVLVTEPKRTEYRIEIVRGNILDHPDFALVDTFQHLDNAKEFAEDYAKDNNVSVCIKSFEAEYNEETKYYEEVENTEKLIYFIGQYYLEPSRTI